MLKEFVEYIVKHLADNKGAVVVTERQEDSKYIVEVRVATDDLGKIIGKGGATIRSIRAVVSLVSAQRGHEVFVEVIQ